MLWRFASLAMAWLLWKQRNQRIFEGNSGKIDDIWSMFQNWCVYSSFYWPLIWLFLVFRFWYKDVISVDALSSVILALFALYLFFIINIFQFGFL
ncbi:hypothetical protein LguiA_026006 [Lonicera macranthoides]